MILPSTGQRSALLKWCTNTFRANIYHHNYNQGKCSIIIFLCSQIKNIFELCTLHFSVSWQQHPYLKPWIPWTSPLDLLILSFRWFVITVLCLFLCIPEGLHRFCHQCEASDPLHAPESPHFPVSSVALCGVAVFWVHRPGHDRSQHHCADDEGERKERTCHKSLGAGAKKRCTFFFEFCRLLRETDAEWLSLY